ATTRLYPLSLHDALPIFGVFLVAVDLPGPPIASVRLEERLQDGRSVLEDGQFLEDLRVHLIQELFLCGKHDFLALELGPREGLRSEEHTSELQSRFDLVC